MHCAHCVRAVEDMFDTTAGISESRVRLGSVEFVASECWNDENKLIEALEIEGFRVSNITTVKEGST